MAMGIRFEGLVVRGKSRKRLSIYGISPGGLGVSAVKLQKEFSATCGTSFGVPSLRMDGENGCGTLEMESRQRFSFTYAGASRRKEGENVCGDQYRFFKGKDGAAFTAFFPTAWEAAETPPLRRGSAAPLPKS